MPALAAGGAMKWATGRIGPAAWVVAGVLVGGGIYWYCKQPPERRERIRKAAGQIGTHLMGSYGTAATGVHQARLQLRACMVPKPEHRHRWRRSCGSSRCHPNRCPRPSSPNCSTPRCGHQWPTSAHS